jgi:hypothetical protein
LIYFLCHPDPKNYQWDIVPLAEGFEELGISFCSNTNYWVKNNGDYLIKAEENVDPLDCNLIIVSTGYLNWKKNDGSTIEGELPSWLIKKNCEIKPKIVLLDFSDGYLSPITSKWYKYCDLLLRAHYNKKIWWPEKTKPWAFGLTRRILNACDKHKTEWNKRRGCIFSFGASHGYAHGAREWAQKHFMPIIDNVLNIDQSQDNLNIEPEDSVDFLLWSQCLKRHSSTFFERLGRSRACAAFCGELIPGLPRKVNYLQGGNRAKIRRIVWAGFSKICFSPYRNLQGDSWRFWEALASGTAVIHFDLQASGWSLPVMPSNWNHYIGINFCDPKSSAKKIRNSAHLLEHVAESGREWALKYYSPKPVAERLLQEISK